MSIPDDSKLPFSLLQFDRTADYPCSYLEGKRAISEVVTPPHLITSKIYSELVRHGFRHSGVFTYRPVCAECSACVPVRLPVARYVPNRSQRRSLKSHENLLARERPLMYFEEHFQLYQRYQVMRHAGGGMDQDSNEQYVHFLLQSSVGTRLIEFTESGVLRMVSLIDLLNEGLSSVYTFYDPDVAGASFGTYNILWQISKCDANRLLYLYLGYWIRNSSKMAYKSNFKPIEGLIECVRQRLDASDPSLDKR